MKHAFALGGLTGFTLTFISALLAGSGADAALRDAALCSLPVALLFRWLRGSLSVQLTHMLRAREEASASLDQAAAIR